MVLGKIIDNRIHYPYNYVNLATEYPNTSFPSIPDKTIFNKYNLVEVQPTVLPRSSIYQKVIEIEPQFYDNQWHQAWKIIDLSEEELASQRVQAETNVRNNRITLLQESDWTQGKDIVDEVSSKWQPYRQALRDITLQPGFPFEVVWPTKPE